LVTCAFQLAGLIFVLVLAYRDRKKPLDLEQAMREIDEYVRTHGAEIDKFIQLSGSSPARRLELAQRDISVIDNYLNVR
jgi:hypothetical protein